MADYYSLLARAVANLPKTSPPSARRAIYERARKALTNQLRSLKPQLPESDIAREERALDEAVARLETEFEPVVAEVQAAPQGEMEAAPPPPPPPPPPRAAPVAPPPAPTPPQRPAAPAVRPAAPTPTPPRSPTLRPSLGSPLAVAAVGLPSAVAFKGPLLGGAGAGAAGTTTAPAPEPPPPPAAPPAEPPPRDEAAPAAAPLGPPRGDREPTRPTLNDAGRGRSSTWLWAGGAVAIGFAAVIVVAALLMRPALQDLTPPAATDSPAVEPTETPAKSGVRIGAAAPTESPSATPTPPPATTAASPTPSPTVAASTPQPSVAPSVASPAPTATPAATPPAPVASQTPEATPNNTVPIAGRAAMLTATVADAAKPAISVGTAVWSIVPAPAGQPAGIGVKAEIDVPDLKLHATMIMRKNFDASLPASHTIDLRVTFDPNSSIKGIKDIALPLMRRDDPPAADPLTGVRVKISDNYFLIGLAREPTDVTHNIQEIGERGWFDFPMQLDDDRIAKLTFEKGADGEKIVAQALAAWK